MAEYERLVEKGKPDSKGFVPVLEIDHPDQGVRRYAVGSHLRELGGRFGSDNFYASENGVATVYASGSSVADVRGFLARQFEVRQALLRILERRQTVS